jgi:hypothetical protein
MIFKEINKTVIHQRNSQRKNDPIGMENRSFYKLIEKIVKFVHLEIETSSHFTNQIKTFSSPIKTHV